MDGRPELRAAIGAELGTLRIEASALTTLRLCMPIISVTGPQDNTTATGKTIGRATGHTQEQLQGKL